MSLGFLVSYVLEFEITCARVIYGFQFHIPFFIIIFLCMMSNKYRIILVDDDEDILWINQISLSQEGYTVDTSDDSEEALDLMISDPYDVAILDYMMPKMRGDELAIKISELLLGTEIVFLTGYSEFAVYMENTGNVRSTVLLKPVESKDLLDAVRSKLERKALIADLKTPSRIRTL